MIRYCDYKSDFKKPESGVSFHYFNSNYNDLHTHNYWEVFLLTSGKLNHFINDEFMVIQKQDLFIIRPTDVHCFYQIGDIQSQHINFMITEETLKNMLDPLSPNLYSFLLQYPKHICLHLKEWEFNGFSDIVSKLYLHKSHLSKTTITKMFISEAVKYAYFQLYSTETDLYEPKSVPPPDWLTELLNRMNSVQYIALPLTDVCEDIAFSQVHINRLFKQYMGTTIGSYFNNIKLKYACKLLETSNFTVLEIASHIGYSSLSHFNRIFKAKFGCTPKEYRQKEKM